MSLPEYILKLVNAIAVQEQFDEYRVESSDASKRGVNFTGNLAFLKISGSKGGKSTPDTLHLVLKTVPSNTNRRQVFQALTGFKAELEMYTKVLPKFVEFQDEKLVKAEDQFHDFPKVYGSVYDEPNDHFAIVMEDLRIKNYKMSPRTDNTTHDHARLVVAKLAQFHAISFAMKDQKLEVFHDIVRSETLFSKFMKDDLGYEIANVFDRSIAALESEKNKKLIEELKTNYLEWVDKFSNEEFVGDSGVLLHGDCGNNNVLFQYDETTQGPSKIILLDWQMSRFGPPMIDLFYFILSTTDKSFRDEHFTDLLNEYYTKLSASIQLLGSDAEKLYPKMKFESDLIKFNRFPLMFACVTTLFRLADEHHILDLDEYAERICKGERPNLILPFDRQVQTLYVKVLNDTINEVVQYCSIN